MFKKSSLLIHIMIFVAILSLSFIVWSISTLASNNQNSGNTVQIQSAQNLKTFTKEELKKYDGQNGNPAYVAVNGIVYDVTNVPAWKDGKHHGYKAGVDLSEEIKNSPHGLKVLDKLPIVGKYVEK